MEAIAIRLEAITSSKDATRNKKLLGAPGLTRNKDATSSKVHYYHVSEAARPLASPTMK